MDKSKLLKIRAAIKNRKPTFMKQDAHKKKRVEHAWRRPRGLHSKIRHNKWSYHKKIQIGYKSPAAVRGLHPSALAPVLIHSLNQIKGLDPKTHGLIIAGDVGTRSKLDIIKAAGAYTILNLKNPQEYLKEVATDLASRKARVAARKTALAEKSKAKIQTAKEAKQTAKPVDEETKKDEEKKEKDKILTQKS